MADSDRDPRIADVFVRVAESLDPDHDLIDVMDIIVQAVTEFTAASEAGIVLADADGVLHVIASTSERAADVEEAQLGAHDGPCFESFQTKEPVSVDDIASVAERWPAFVQTAEDRGLRSVHAMPMLFRGHALGAVNVFGPDPGPLSARELDLIRGLTQIAAVGLVAGRTLDAERSLNRQLQGALDSRVVIEQAKGVIAERHDTGIDEAFGRLRDHARSTGARLRDVAQRVVDHQLSV